jgi:hypothetical protein
MFLTQKSENPSEFFCILSLGETCSSSELLPVYEAENNNDYKSAHRIMLITSVLIKLNYKYVTQQRPFFPITFSYAYFTLNFKQ